MNDLFQLSKKTIEDNGIKKKAENNDSQVAIIGIALRFPMSDTMDEFWEIIEKGRDCIKEIGGERRKDIISYMTKLGYTNIDLTEMASLKEIDKFDYKFFGYTPKEAEHIEPGQRLFLEVAYSAMEDAGYGGDILRGSNTGVYVGYAGDSSYKQILSASKNNNSSLSVIGNMPSLIGSRMSHIFDLHGPNMTINTTCSSALVALNYACQDIREKKCNMAIVGCSSLMFFPQKGLRGLGIESPTFRTKAFDINADGTGAGEGVAAIIIKDLEDAKRDKDNIYAVIKSIAVNHDGNSIGITAPNPEAQEEVISRALKYAGINPETIGYFEAHGTGTKLGDPIEIKGITSAYSRYTSKKKFIPIGSVKTNIGHTFISSGMASLIKSVLMLKNRVIPALINFNSPNPEINFEDSPVYINKQNIEWAAKDGPRRCGISSFGLSGTNAHVIVEEWKETENYMSDREFCGVLTISAKSKASLNMLIQKYYDLIQSDKNIPIENMCYTSNVGRGHFTYRIAIICNSKEDLKEQIKILINQDTKLYEKWAIYVGGDSNGSYDQRIVEGLKVEGCNREALKELCRAYISGADVNWSKFHSNRKRKKISLPTYAFEKNRCWIQIDNEVYNNTSSIPNELKNNTQLINQKILSRQLQIINQQRKLLELNKQIFE